MRSSLKSNSQNAFLAKSSNSDTFRVLLQQSSTAPTKHKGSTSADLKKKYILSIIFEDNAVLEIFALGTLIRIPPFRARSRFRNRINSKYSNHKFYQFDYCQTYRGLSQNFDVKG